ncbi:hypothetical protein MHH33_00280 [Paenisporosarcina sp. FSL H8-0542]
MANPFEIKILDDVVRAMAWTPSSKERLINVITKKETYHTT